MPLLVLFGALSAVSNVQCSMEKCNQDQASFILIQQHTTELKWNATTSARHWHIHSEKSHENPLLFEGEPLLNSAHVIQTWQIPIATATMQAESNQLVTIYPEQLFVLLL